MKKTINNFSRVLGVLLLCAGLAMTGCYDDSVLQGQIGSLSDQLQDHESRLKELERLTAQQNTNISSLQTIVTALQDKDYVTSVAPIYEGDEVVGYTITFSKSGAVTIYNGKDGYVPAMGVKQDEYDGQWYWTVDGEWLLDSKGGKVRASAEDGEDGAPGQPGVTPTLKIVDGYWYVSYDGGKTWEEETLGQATGDKGYTMFAEVTYDEEYLYITMADGEKLVLPRTSVGQEVEGPLTWSLDKVTATTATFTGHFDVPASDLSFSQVTVFYTDAQTFNMYAAESVSATSFDSEQNFTITLNGLKYGTKYNYCMVADVKSEKTYGDVLDFTTVDVTLSELSVVPGSFKAEVSGSVAGLSVEDKENIKIGILYSSESGKVENGEGKKVETAEISSEDAFSIQLSDLTLETKYYYCGYMRQGDSYTYGVPSEFTTLRHPYGLTYDLNVSSATDLSSAASANCYIISEAGLYKIKAVKGNSATSVGSVASASILWETFGTDTTPEVLDLISGFCYKDGYIAFQTADTFKEGNAVIAAKDASGNILWSWHIWFTDQPQAHVYNNNAGTMMDRNLGATSATPGDVGALGLLYQWGRKDPFLGSSSISSSTLAKSTITWPSAVETSSSVGTVDYVTSNPTTFVKGSSSSKYDWHYASRDNTLWTTSDKTKSIYDPCPSGWRVPDGGYNGIWSKAGFDDTTCESTNEGKSKSFSISSPSKTWYPASGYRHRLDGGLSNVGDSGYYWSASPGSLNSFDACRLLFGYYGNVDLINDSFRASGFSVRCLQE